MSLGSGRSEEGADLVKTVTESRSVCEISGGGRRERGVQLRDDALKRMALWVMRAFWDLCLTS